jgi:hypothetical protein
MTLFLQKLNQCLLNILFELFQKKKRTRACVIPPVETEVPKFVKKQKLDSEKPSLNRSVVVSSYYCQFKIL